MSRRIDKALFARIGRPCTWERAVLSLDRQEDGQVSLLSPPQDRGYVFEPAVSLRALFTSDGREQEQDMAGMWERGECRMTFDPAYRIGPQDRVTWTDLVVRSTFEIRASGQATDPLPPYLTKLLSIRTGSGLLSSLEFAGEPGSDGVLLLVRWASVPSAGTRFSVTAEGRPVWVVQSESVVRAFGRTTKNQLPGRVSLRRDFALLRDDWR